MYSLISERRNGVMPLSRLAMLPVIAATLATPAGAAETYWSSVTTGCVPDSLSIQDDRYKSLADAAITPRTSRLDPIVLICGVLPNPGAPAPHALKLTYQDSTGTGATGMVRAQLVYVVRTTGVRAVMATLSSDTSTATGATMGSAAFSHTLDFEANYYYVRIDIRRGAAGEDVRGIGAALSDS
jgi:hypothetical protein